MSALLHHLSEAVGDGQGRIDESLHAAHETRLRPVVQLRPWAVHTLVPADVSEIVHLDWTEVTVQNCGTDVQTPMSQHYSDWFRMVKHLCCGFLLDMAKIYTTHSNYTLIDIWP